MVTSRQELDPIFKILFINFLTSLSIIAESEVEVGRLPRKIDLLVFAETEFARQQLRTKTPLRYISRFNQVEFKGRNDPLNIKGVARILGRTYLYISDENRLKSFDEMSVTIICVICAGKPRTVLREMDDFKQIDEGIYQKDGSPQITIMVINQLPTIPENYPLLLFASSKEKFKQFFTQLIDNLGNDPANNPYLHLAYIVRPDVAKELNAMSMYPVPRGNLQYIANDIGDKLLEFIPQELIVDAISDPSELVSRLSYEEIAVIMEEKRWQMVQSGRSAQARIDIIRKMPDSERAIVLDVSNRTKLVSGLNEDNVVILYRWAEAEEA